MTLYNLKFQDIAGHYLHDLALPTIYLFHHSHMPYAIVDTPMEDPTFSIRQDLPVFKKHE